MRVSHVAVDDFRSWRHAVVEFPPGVTVLVGANGQGKTNLVEAIAYLSTFSSHRVSAESALVRVPSPGEEPAPAAVVRVRLVRGGRQVASEVDEADGPAVRDQLIELEIVRGKANRARLNRTQVRPRDILGHVRTVLFAPEDLGIVRGDPSERRAFLDDILTQTWPVLSRVRSDFERVARQRAALMKSAQARVRRGHTPDLSTLDVWDGQFAELSARLTLARRRIVAMLEAPAVAAYADVAASPKVLSLAMDASVDRVLGDQTPGGTDALALLATGDRHAEARALEAETSRLREALARVRSKEIERGVNLVGAHRDDLTLGLGGLPVKGYASHGESWSVALALRLAAFAVLTIDSDQPILILDDVFAELDARRREGLARLVADADQVIVTAAVAEDVPEGLDGHRLRVWSTPEEGSHVEAITDVD